MAKETYYFSHDYNARNDKKIAALVKDYKASGYGIFWATCEMMHEEGGILEFDDLTTHAIAKAMNETPELVGEILENCVSKYRLFSKQTKQNEAEIFASILHSSRVIRNLDEKNGKKQIKAESGRLGGIKSGESRRNNNSAKQNEASRSTASSNEPKERKGKEIKEYDVGSNGHEAMTEKEFKNFSEKMKADKLFTEPLFSAGVKPEFLEKWVLRFHIHIVGEGNIKKDYNEYRTHFKRWLNKQDYSNPPPALSPLERIKQNGTSASYIKAESEVDFDKYRKK